MLSELANIVRHPQESVEDFAVKVAIQGLDEFLMLQIQTDIQLLQLHHPEKHDALEAALWAVRKARD